MKNKPKQLLALTFAFLSLGLTGCSNQPASDKTSTTEITQQDESAKESSITAEKEPTLPAPSPSTQTETDSGENETQDYILPDSSTRELTESDITDLTPDGLKFARNEIYARHGRKFKSEELQEYFSSKSWYQGTVEGEQFSESMLSDVERKNVDFLKAHEEPADPSAPGMKYKNIMKNSDILDQYGLTDYGYIWVTSSEGKTLTDKGSYYEVTGQTLETPIYYEWSYVSSLKPGDQLTYEWSGKRRTGTVTRILNEKDKKYRIVEVEDPSDNYKSVYIFEDIFNKGKYAMADMVERSDGDIENYIDYDHYPRSNGLTDCSSKIVYSGSFYLAKNCVVDVGGTEYTVEEMMDEDSSSGSIAGWIEALDSKGCITRIRQQTAG